ncbi:hypothetical protein BOX15_Mlig031150g6 [Macrostomum lignano]|uniref:J domain-containing protein n=2 Tax=Macrostomum lignano TaxID=282301 RepID=A0A1I8H818_9PLAT|nr:hypothetical protein BOX15_Mlig031150g6 [Macrostomum lignano]
MTLDKNDPAKVFRIKIISMGNSDTGKSCIIKRYCEKRFVQKYLMTIGIDFGVTKVTVGDRDVKVNIFDFAGHPVFYEVRNEFYRDVQGVMLVYDVTNRASFESLDAWIKEMKSELGAKHIAEFDSAYFVVCAYKVDKKQARVVDELEGRLWSDARGYPYFETSALNGDGVSEMFKCLFDGVVEAVISGKKPQPIPVQLGYNTEQIEAIKKLKSGRDNYERLGVAQNCTKEDINKAYRRLAVLLHPDKSVAPGSEEAFKILVNARNQLLLNVKQ